MLFVFKTVPLMILLCLSDHNKKGANMNNRTMGYGWRQNENYVGGATCSSSKYNTYYLTDL